MANYAEKLPKMLFGEELKEALTCLPEYDASIREADPGTRLLRLTDLYKVFLPGTMASEIYHKLYMMTSMSLSQKGTVASVRQLNANHKWMNGGEFHGVATGATSATVIGASGIGKSTCIRKAMDMLGGIIEIEQPYRKIIPVLMVSTPFDCNYKGLLCQVLMAIDEALDTNYYEKSQKSTMNAQQILGMVSQVCHQFVGTLIIDEIQFIVQHKAGQQLYRMILQLINTSCNILLVGTNECLPFFTQDQNAFQMARRSVGLQYEALDYGEEFKNLCGVLFSYQYVKNETSLTDRLTFWLYEHTGGNPSTLVSLIHDAQEIAILEGTEVLGLDALTKAYNSRLQMLHGYINPGITKKAQAGTVRSKSSLPRELSEERPVMEATPYKETAPVSVSAEGYTPIAEIVDKAKRTNLNIVALMKEHFPVVEVAV